MADNTPQPDPPVDPVKAIGDAMRARDEAARAGHLLSYAPPPPPQAPGQRGSFDVDAYKARVAAHKASFDNNGFWKPPSK